MFTPKTCGVWHVDQIISTEAAERFVEINCTMLQMDTFWWRCWLRKLPEGDDRADVFPNGKRFYNTTVYLSQWLGALWLYRSWVVPKPPGRRDGQKLA